MKTTTFGLDLAKRVFQIHWVDMETGEIGKRQLKRDQVRPFFANRAPAVVAMEACGSAHYWARQLTGLGHDVRLVGPRTDTFGRGQAVMGLPNGVHFGASEPRHDGAAIPQSQKRN